MKSCFFPILTPINVGRPLVTALSLVMLFQALIATTSFSQTTTNWTGLNDDWDDPDNWSDGVPDENSDVVFGTSSTIDEVQRAGDVHINSVRFTSDLGSDPFTTGTTGTNWFRVGLGDAVVVEAGAPEISIVTSTARGLRIQRDGGSPDPTIVKNDSDHLLSITTVRGTGSGHALLQLEGSGDVMFTHGLETTAGFLTLAETFSGAMIIPEDQPLNNWNDTNLNGGTLVLDGIARAKEYGNHLFNVNDGAVLTGNGVVGGAQATYNFIFNANAGSTVDPGRIGETGILTFENFDATFHEGATLQLDLLNSSTHDQLLFALVGEEPIHKLPDLILDTDGSGVQLSLNLLDGFSGNIHDEFLILQGYDQLLGHFAGLEQGAIFEVDGYQFQIDYGADSTILTIIPEPSSIGLLLLATAFLWSRRKLAA